MDLLLILLGIFALIALYFCLGAVTKFLWGWLPMILGMLIALLVGISGGWIAGTIGVFLALLTLTGVDSWHRNTVYLRVASVIDKTFYFEE